MTLVPSGKTRVMVAQTISSPLTEGYEAESIASNPEIRPDFETEEALEEDTMQENNGIEGVDSISEDIPTQQETPAPQGEKTLTNYVFNKLKSYGYPGRRLQEFKSKFVRESVSPEGVKDIQIEIPDKKYPGADGISNTIENEDLKEITGEINKAFGLNFNGAERSDGKWTIKFTSEKLSDPDEQNIVRDNLDEVYGKPSASKNKEPKKAVSYTIRELIKEAKDEAVQKLIKGKGD